MVHDLHDGAHQRPVHTVISLELASRALESGDAQAGARQRGARAGREAKAELRELSHGTLPTTLTRGDLRAGVDALAARMPVPTENDVAEALDPRTARCTCTFAMTASVARSPTAASALLSNRLALLDGQLPVDSRRVAGRSPPAPPASRPRSTGSSLNGASELVVSRGRLAAVAIRVAPKPPTSARASTGHRGW